MYDHKKAIQDNAKSQKATHGYEMRQEKHEAMFLSNFWQPTVQYSKIFLENLW